MNEENRRLPLETLWHPRTEDCARGLGIQLPQLASHLELLRQFVHEFRDTEDELSVQCGAQTAAARAGWGGDSKAFFDQLDAAGFAQYDEERQTVVLGEVLG